MPAGQAARSSDTDLQRSVGSCRIVLKGSERGNQIVDVFQRAPVRVLFPRVGNAFHEAVLINTRVVGPDHVIEDTLRFRQHFRPAPTATHMASSGRSSALTAGIDDLGSAALMVDFASMLHETQYTRLFRS